MRGGLLAAALLWLAGPAWANSIEVTSTPIASFERLGAEHKPKPFAWRGGLTLTSEDERFGGFSGLSLSDDCRTLLAVSDKGKWFSARLDYDAQGRLANLSETRLVPMRDSKGRVLKDKYPSDAEALFRLGPGQYAVGFESYVRVVLYDLRTKGFAAPYRIMKSPKSITEGPQNGQLESLGKLNAGPYKGYYIAISEKYHDPAGNIYGWLWKGPKTVMFSIERNEDYDITDLAVMPGGEIMILERSYTTGSLPGMAIRRFSSADVKIGKTVRPKLLFAGRYPFYAIDNMEGIALCKMNGETRVTIMSDDNFNRTLQSTLLLQFDYRP